MRHFAMGVLLLAGLVGAPVAWRIGWPVRPDTPHPPLSAGTGVATASEERVSLVHLAERRTPFRLGGRPARVRYGVAPPVPLPPPAPQPPRPVLVLTGILWGSDPAAIVEGIPGRDGAVVLHRGDAAGLLKVEAIARDWVRISGLDTSWTLTVRQPWR